MDLWEGWWVERWVTWGEMDKMGFCSLTCAVDTADSAATSCRSAPASKCMLVVSMASYCRNSHVKGAKHAYDVVPKDMLLVAWKTILHCWLLFTKQSGVIPTVTDAHNVTMLCRTSCSKNEIVKTKQRRRAMYCGRRHGRRPMVATSSN